jgi:hypothetical protein
MPSPCHHLFRLAPSCIPILLQTLYWHCCRYNCSWESDQRPSVCSIASQCLQHIEIWQMSERLRHGSRFARRHIPRTCPISWRMVFRNFSPPLPRKYVRSATSNATVPLTGNPFELRTYSGPAKPKTFLRPPMGLYPAQKNKSSIIGGHVQLSPPRVLMFDKSSVMMDSHLAAADPKMD